LLYKNWAVLFTQRLQVQPIGILFSNLSGALVGILGLFGSLMGIFEGKYIKYKRNKSHLVGIRNVEESREGLFYKNFIENQLERYHTEKPKVSGNPEQSFDNKSSTDHKPKMSKSKREPEHPNYSPIKIKLPRSFSDLKPDDFDLVS
jgi:hypothetical protein